MFEAVKRSNRFEVFLDFQREVCSLEIAFFKQLSEWPPAWAPCLHSTGYRVRQLERP